MTRQRVAISSRFKVQAIGPVHGGEDVMATWWSGLSEISRRLIIAAAIGEVVLKTAVLIDIRRRPASQIRGSKWMWIIAAVLVNSAGVGPLSYFVFGRRHAESAELRARAE
jgi:Phospholipase_D-nuclease N-terminal